MKETYPFSVEPLSYSYFSLEPFLCHEILILHHDKHYASYVKNLNDVLSRHTALQSLTLEELLLSLSSLPSKEQIALRNYGGGVYNHLLYFRCMKEPSFSLPKEPLLSMILDSFESFDLFLNQFLEQSMNLFGSGYVWLVLAKDLLEIVSSKNQDTPLSNDMKPLLCIDLWEHSYYLQYQNRKADYINNWFSLLNWEYVSVQYDMAQKKN